MLCRLCFHSVHLPCRVLRRGRCPIAFERVSRVGRNASTRCTPLRFAAPSLQGRLLLSPDVLLVRPFASFRPLLTAESAPPQGWSPPSFPLPPVTRVHRLGVTHYYGRCLTPRTASVATWVIPLRPPTLSGRYEVSLDHLANFPPNPSVLTSISSPVTGLPFPCRVARQSPPTFSSLSLRSGVCIRVLRTPPHGDALPFC